MTFNFERPCGKRIEPEIAEQYNNLQDGCAGIFVGGKIDSADRPEPASLPVWRAEACVRRVALRQR